MTKDEALRMAIDALEMDNDCECGRSREIVSKLINALQACKDALAETQEPVAWMNNIAFSMYEDELTADNFGDIIPLYTKPPSREWVGLSDDEITHIGMSCQSLHQVARAIEAKLRAING